MATPDREKRSARAVMVTPSSRTAQKQKRLLASTIFFCLPGKSAGSALES